MILPSLLRHQPEVGLQDGALDVVRATLWSYGWMTSRRGSGADSPASWFSGVCAP